MSQSALVVGLLATAFLLYVAATGRLTTYTGVLFGSSAKSDEKPKDNGSPSDFGFDFDDFQKWSGNRLPGWLEDFYNTPLPSFGN